MGVKKNSPLLEAPPSQYQCVNLRGLAEIDPDLVLYRRGSHLGAHFKCYKTRRRHFRIRACARMRVLQMLGAVGKIPGVVQAGICDFVASEKVENSLTRYVNLRIVYKPIPEMEAVLEEVDHAIAKARENLVSSVVLESGQALVIPL